MKKTELKYYDLGTDVVAFSTTRQGGYGTGNYAEFNITHYCGDDQETVKQNRAALCQLLNIKDEMLILPRQTHQTEICNIDEDFFALSETDRLRMLEGVDAVMTNLTGVCIGVSTADCIPILLYDPIHRIAAAVHAGWRGTVARIVEKTIRTMSDNYGSKPYDMVAQIGPGISLDSFEVGDEVYDAFQQAAFDMALISKRFLVPDSSTLTSKWHIDLPKCNRLQLLSCGIPSEHIATSPFCTYQNPETFFSARRLGIHSGRIFTGILLL